MNPILPAGTQVVSRIPILPTGVPNKADGTGHRPLHPAGAVGVITSAPVDHTHAYRVRFPDGYEASLRRDELTPLRDFQGAADAPDRLAHPLAEYDLQHFVILRCVIGSRAYGLDHADSDTDRRGVYLPPADLHWSLYGIPEQLENKDTEECYWELQKFLVLALKANPNVLECLYTPLVEHASPLAQELLAMRRTFLSTLAYQTYNGYVMSQFKKLCTDIRNKGDVKWKHVMHLLRLLLSGITLLKDGDVPVRVPPEHRDALLAIKHGIWTWDQADAWRLDLHRQFDAALATSPLPPRPDYAAANAFLLKARRSMM
jgi:hypothetical protein